MNEHKSLHPPCDICFRRIAQLAKRLWLLAVVGLGISACITQIPPTATPTYDPYIESDIDPTPFLTLEDQINALSSSNPTAVLVNTYAITTWGDDAEAAIPALIANLRHLDPRVRKGSCFVLGYIGPAASGAVPTIGERLLYDSDDDVRVEAARSLREFGDRSAVPYLAQALYDEDRWVNAISAESLIWLTGETFSENTVEHRDGAYILNDQGIPYIVVNARIWWETEGQVIDWGNSEPVP